MSELPSYNSANFVSNPESISMANNNVVNKADEYNLHQEQQQQFQPHPYDPPYLIRHSRAFRHFKNPPQPHMCIKDHTDDGQELYINVMSWTKICMPHSATDPIPLYGGMRVTPGSPKSPALVFAVMANPAILKHVGRKCSDVEEKCALVKLMCDFVEAMNPGLKLARDAEVLKDRDLSGELKDIWGAVQAKRLREKDAAPSYESYMATQNQIYADFGPDTGYQPELIKTPAMTANPVTTIAPSSPPLPPPPPTLLTLVANDKESKQLISVLNADEGNNMKHQSDKLDEQCPESKLQKSAAVENEANDISNMNKSAQSQRPTDIVENNISKCDEKIITTVDSSNVSNKSSRASNEIHSNNNGTIKTKTSSSTVSNKKEKLGGFLPNGCHNIFPFIKIKNSHEKHTKKERNNDTQKESNSSRKSKDDNDTANLENVISKLELTKSQS